MRRYYRYYHRSNYVGFVIVILAILVYLIMDFNFDDINHRDEFIGCEDECYDK